MTGFKVAVLLVAKTANQSEILAYSFLSRDGGALTRKLQYNMGVNTSRYGQPSSGLRCLHGFHRFDLYFHSPANLPGAFYFTYDGEEINGLAFKKVYYGN